MPGSPRVVSLIPSMTETLASWGIEPAGCTRFCLRSDLPDVGGTKDPDLEHIAALEPALVIMDTEENQREDAEALVASGIEVHVLSIRSLEDVVDQLGDLAERLQVSWRPPELHAPPTASRRAIVPIWRRPWMALGSPTYGSSVLARLGIVNVFADRGSYPGIDPDHLADLESDLGADLIIAPDEPYPFGERHRDELAAMAPGATVAFVDGRDLLWWGVRTEGALGRLRDALRPDPLP